MATVEYEKELEAITSEDLSCIETLERQLQASLAEWCRTVDDERLYDTLCEIVGEKRLRKLFG